MTIQRAWQMPQELEALSTTPWPQCISEWKVRSIRMLDPSEDSQSCLCGHTPIRELCYLQNTKNQKQTIVGNHCVALFVPHQSNENVFSAVPRIFDAAKRILQNPMRSANSDLIEFATNRGVLNRWEHDFYLDIMRKRTLSPKQESVKHKLNTKLIRFVTRAP